jgi:hypothetical protein
MRDRLLWTRRQKARDAAFRLGGVLGPTALLVLLVLATGGQATAVAMAGVGGLIGLAVVTDVGTPRGALYAGLVIAGVLLLLDVAIAYAIDHPILE